MKTEGESHREKAIAGAKYIKHHADKIGWNDVKRMRLQRNKRKAEQGQHLTKGTEAGNDRMTKRVVSSFECALKVVEEAGETLRLSKACKGKKSHWRQIRMKIERE